MKKDSTTKEDKGIEDVIEEFDEKAHIISDDDDFIEKHDVQEQDDK